MRNNSKYTPTLHACYLGYITQAIVVNLAPLFFVIFQNKYGIGYEAIANLVLVTFIIQIIVDALMIKLVSVIGYRASAVSAHVFSAIGIAGMGIMPMIMDPYTGILISVLVYSFGGGLIEVVVSPIVDALPGDAKASAMSLLHSFYSWGQMLVVIITTLLLTCIGNDLWFLIPLLWALIPFFNIFKFLKVPIVNIEQEQKHFGIGKFLKSPVFIIALLLMFCGGAAELVMSQWASLFAERGLGIPKIAGDLFGPCLFALFMGIGRTIYGVFGEKINLEKALLGCSAFTIVCYLITVFVQLPILSLMGCALCGFGVSLMWPGMLSYTSQKYNYKAGPVLFSLLALGGDLGCSVGPWLTGKISDTYLSSLEVITTAAESQAIRYGLLAAAIFPVIMLLLVFVMKKLPQKF